MNKPTYLNLETLGPDFDTIITGPTPAKQSFTRLGSIMHGTPEDYRLGVTNMDLVIVDDVPNIDIWTSARKIVARTNLPIEFEKYGGQNPYSDNTLWEYYLKPGDVNISFDDTKTATQCSVEIHHEPTNITYKHMTSNVPLHDVTVQLWVINALNVEYPIVLYEQKDYMRTRIVFASKY
jgi:hypothetical protein